MTEADPGEIFRIEAQELLEQIELGLLDMSERPDEPEIVAGVFRALHTLKGSGAMFGFDALAAFTHHCESAFDLVRRGEAAATPQLIGAVLAAKDHMRALAQHEPTSPGTGEALLAALQRAVHGARAAGAAPVATPRAPTSRWRVRFQLAPDVLVNGTRPLSLLDELRSLGECEVVATTEATPELERLIPTECHLGWTLDLTTEHPRAAIEDVFMFVIDDMTLEIEPFATPPEASEPVPDAADACAAQSAAAAAPPAEAHPSKAQRSAFTTRVPAERLDQLMDGVGELVIAQSRLKQVAIASEDLRLRSVAEEIEQLATELRDTVMSIRMVPVGQLFSRFRRLVHDLAAETGKTIELVTDGEATELDKTVIERLADPLVHVVRNSADHGLETAEARIAAGKPATGRISLSARQAGAEVVITIADDGRGIDRDRVRAKAEENGLIVPGAAMTDADLLQLIFHPGFSTAGTVTSLSGRGVGMDVVKRTVEALRGTIEVVSALGEGSQVRLRIPLTLAIIDGLLVRVGAARYVIPLSAVEECLELTTDQDMRSTGHNFLTVRERLVPFIRLREMFSTGAPDRHQKVVVVAAGGERVGLVVDQILGDHQTVIKPLSTFHAEVGAFAGATILGDGGVALILDVGHMATAGAHRAAAGALRVAS